MAPLSVLRDRLRLFIGLLALAAVLCVSTAAVEAAAPVARLQAQLLGPGHPVQHPARRQVHRPRPKDEAALATAKAAAPGRGGSRAPSTGGGVTPYASVVSGVNQAGLAATDNTPANQGTPPDSTGSIGPSNYVEFVNSKLRVYDRSLATLSTADLDVFVGKSGDSVFDPQVQWDQQGNRWIYAAVDQTATGYALVFGFSKTADPSDLVNGWCRYSVASTGLPDYPKLGHDDGDILVGTNQFTAAGRFTTARVWVAPKPANGTSTCPASETTTTFDLASAFTPVPVNTADSAAGGYVVAAADPGTGSASQLTVWQLSHTGGSLALPAVGTFTVPSYSVPANVPQPGSSDQLDTMDARLTEAVGHADPDAGGAEAIWTQHTVAGAGGRSAVRWYELIPSTGSARQAGTVQDATNFDFNGAISPTESGNEAVVEYNVGGASQLVQIRAQSRVSGTALSTTGGETQLGTSAAADADFSCPSSDPTSPSCRWGDYSGASPDPASSHAVWGSNQLNGPQSGSDPAWTTRNFAVSASAGSAAGNWVGTYGSAGYVLGAWNGSTDVASVPNASVNLAQGSRWVWSSSTSDGRALQGPDGSTRQAATWYDPNQVQLQLSFSQAYSGPLRLYAVDWDSTARRETVTVNDGSTTQTTALSGDFSQGAWITAQVNVAAGGTVTITATRNAGKNAVLSGVFLGGVGSPAGLNYVAAPQGGWFGTYGSAGYLLGAWNGSTDAGYIPNGQTQLLQGSRYDWATGTSDVRALQGPDGSTRTAGTWYDANQVRLQLSFSAAYSGPLRLYAVDWDGRGRRETVTVNDGSGARNAYLSGDFSQGAWITAPVNVAAGGTVSVTVTRNSGVNAVLSGVFLGGSGSPPALAYTSAPQGTWAGSFGSSGYVLSGWNSSTDLASLPTASLSVPQASRWVWASTTQDVRALQSPDASTRRAATWYSANQIQAQLTFSSAYSGPLRLYAVDWDARGRRQTVTINDSNGPQTVYLGSDFTQGAWVTAQVSVAAGGTITVTATRNAGVNAVVSGLFLG